MMSWWERWSRRLIGLVALCALVLVVWFAYTNGRWQPVGEVSANQAVLLFKTLTVTEIQ